MLRLSLTVAGCALLVACGGPAPPPAVVGRPPAPGVHRYIAGGDSRGDHAHVMPWAIREARARGASGFFFLGDMELTPGFDGHFEGALRDLDPVPFFPVLGNHEVKMLGFLGIGQEAAERQFRARFLGNGRTPVTSVLDGKVVYSVDLPGGLHFVALDNVSQRGFGADQLAWLGADLARARSDGATRHIVVGMHKPLARSGVAAHGMESDGDEAILDSDAALALFVQANVSLILASHVHEYAQTNAGGIPLYVSGGLGAPLVGSGGAEHAFHHFLELDVSDEGVRVAVVRFDGKPSTTPDADRD